MALQRSGQSAATILAVRAPPVEAGERRLPDPESIHEGDEVGAKRRRLAVANRFAREKSRRAVAAQIWDDRPVARRREQWGDVDKAVNVIGPAVQQNDRRPVGGAGLGVADVEDAGVDLLQRAERGIRSRLECGQLWLLRLGMQRADRPELSGGNHQAHGAEEAATMMVDVFQPIEHTHANSPWFADCPAPLVVHPLDHVDANHIPTVDLS
jgi:hypothetical protein